MKKRILIGTGVAMVLAIAGGAVWLVAATDPTHQIGPNTASPAYIVVNTPTPVTFTSVIADSNLKKHDPKKVLLIRTDAAGTPIDILGRLNDRGKKADADKKDHEYTIQVTLNEPAVGPIQFRIAAKFKDALFKGKDDDDDNDWDGDLTTLKGLKNKKDQQDRLSKLLRRLDRYTLSNPIQVTVDPVKLPPDPGEAGKQTLQGIDSDRDGVRDDIQRFISYHYAGSAKTRAAASQSAAAFQQVLNSSNNPVQTAVAWNAVITAVDCLTYVVGPANVVRANALLESESLNTSLRSNAFLRAIRTRPNPTDNQNDISQPDKTSCRFNPDSLPN